MIFTLVLSSFLFIKPSFHLHTCVFLKVDTNKFNANVSFLYLITLANSQFVTGERSCFLSLFLVTDYEFDV